MDMFGMMGEIMGNMVSSVKQFQISRKYLPSQVIPVSEQNVIDLYYFLLLRKESPGHQTVRRFPLQQ